MSLGQKLRQERERRGVTLADIAKETRISSRHLEAIETGDTKTMPRDFFYRSFARQYATYLGIDPKEIDAGIELEMGAPMAMAAAASSNTVLSPASAAPKSLSTPLPKTVPAKLEPVPVPEVSPRVFLQESRTTLPWLALAGLMVAAAVSYLAWDRVGGESSVRKETAAGNETPQAADLAKEAGKDTTKDTTKDTAVAQRVTMPNGTTVEATKLSSGTLKLIISAKEPAWIQLDADGKALFVGLLEPGQSREVDATQQAKLLTGNAGGIHIIQNGKAIPDLGLRGEVRTVVFDKEKYEVIRPVSAPKSEPSSKPDSPKSDPNPVAE